MDNNVRWPVDLLHSVAVPPRWRLPGVLPQYGLVDEDNAGNRYEMLVRNGGFITLRVLHNWQEVASAESDYMSNGHFAMCHDWNGTGMCVYNHGYDLRVFWSDSEDVRVEGATPPLGVACAYDNGVWYVFNQCAYGVEVWVSTGDGFSLGLSGDDSGPCKDLTFSGAVLMGAFVYRVAGQAKVCLMWLRPTWDGRWEWVRVDSNYKDIDARSSEDTASVSSSLGALYVAGERYTGTTELTSRVGTEGVDTQAEVFRPFLSRCEVESVGFIVSETTAVASVMDTTCDTFDRYSADTSYVTQQTGYWLLAPYVTSGSSFPILRYLGLMPNVLDITISMLFDSVSGNPAVLYIDLSDGIRLRVSSFYGIFGPSGSIHQLLVSAVRGYTVLSSAYGSLGTGHAEPAWPVQPRADGVWRGCAEPPRRSSWWR